MKKFISFITSVIMISSMTGSMAYAEGTWLPGGGYIPEGMEVDETPKSPDIVREPVDPELTAKLKVIYEQLQQFDDAHSTIFFNEGINNKILFTSTDQDIVDKVNQFIADNGIDQNLVSAELEFPEEAVLITDVTTDEPLETVTAVTSSVQQQTIITTTTAETNGQRIDLRDFYEEIKEFSDTAYAKYKKMSVEDAYKDICGNYAMLSDNLNAPTVRNTTKLTMDENGKLHGIINIWTEACIKVKSGTELSDIPSSIKYRINDDMYILKSDDMRQVSEYIESIKNNENILAIDNHYGIYEDTANYYNIDGFRYDGEALTESFISEFPLLGLAISDFDMGSGNYITCKIDRDAAPDEVYKELIRLKESIPALDVVFIQTELALETPDIYYCSYCSSPILIDGLKGDANVDGDMDISDAVMIMQSLANPDKYGVNKEKGITYQGIKNADTNKDGITNTDALNIQKELLGL
ncbi:dockerin type I repeat-containing protein [Ruminococcus sp.]|uniref:dockerin type I repeat-containing protein n=1 Tax=Ruminococcus sp. TaxID=41978 RepID=UPI0025FD2C4B|nr:dockerin type I repeat-containing protein [Ruminococcus sp.]